MKIEIEIPDLEEVCYSSYYEGESITIKDFKEKLVDIAIEKLVDRMYDDYTADRAYISIQAKADELIKTYSKDIINNVTDRVTDKILAKKKIVDEMPKKSEFTKIDKEWENYFVQLIDKAIAKRFK